MIKQMRLFLLSLVAMVILVSCHTSPSNAEIASIKALHEGLLSYNLSLTNEVDRAHNSLEEKCR
jgi:hypothetical protein